MITGPSRAAVWWLAAHAGAFAAIAIAAFGVGRLCLHGHRFRSALEGVVFATAIGLGVWATILFLLGLAGDLNARVIAVATVAAAATTATVGLRQLWKSRRAWPRSMPSGGFWSVAAVIILSVVCWLALFARTLYPPIEWDSVSHHLPLARYFLEDGRVSAPVGLPYPILPELHHMLFVWALAIGDDVVAQMIEHLFLVLVALGLFAWGRRVGAGLAFSFALGTLVLAQPLMLWLSESAYVDLGITCFAFLGVYALRVFWDEGEGRWWYLAMALFGFAAGVRHQGLQFLGIGAVLGAWRCLRPAPGFTTSAVGVNRAVAGWALGLVAIVPWYGFIAYTTQGDPVWPIAPQLAHGLWATPRVVQDWRNMYVHAAEPRTLINFLRLPYDWVMNASRFSTESAHPLMLAFMAWPVTWLVMFRDRSVRWWALWALVSTVAWFAGAHFLRYWLPTLPLAAIALYESIRWLAEKVHVPRAAQAIGWSLVGLVSVGFAMSMSVREVAARGRPPITDVARRTFLLWNLGGYWAVDYVNSHAKPGDRAYLILAPWLNYYLAPRTTDYVGILQHGHWPVFRWPDDARWIGDLDATDTNWIVVNHVYKPPDSPDVPSDLPLRTLTFWPDYELAYGDPLMWVFRRKLSPPAERLKLAPQRQAR